MNISAPFIRRPVMTILVMAAMLIFGAFGYSSLPVSELPNVDFPTISVSASLPGANPETMASAVATPLEAEFSTIAGISSMTSTSAQGQTSITIQFELDRSIDGAAQDVQSAIAAAVRHLPPNMPSPPTMRKENPADSPILFLVMRSPTLPMHEVNKYAETLLARQLSTISGVAKVNVFGGQQYAVRIQADPIALAARGIGIDQIAAAVDASNSNSATGSLSGPSLSAIIQSTGQLTDAKQFARQIITYRDGAPVRLGEIGRVFDSVANDKQGGWFNGERAIVLAILRQPGANTIAVVDGIQDVLPRFMEQLPASISLETSYDRSINIRASVSDVQITLLISAALVVAVIFLFLRTISATFVASLALPIAIIGTFAGMAYFGYSLNNLSLMALTLSVGFVVDDAIVMLENIVRHTEKGEKPMEAALVGSREIGFTILSMTISLAAVFIPVLFMGGIVGRLLHEFAVTIVIAIVVSGIVSVTLTPMMLSRMLKRNQHVQQNAFQHWCERSFERLQSLYERSLRWGLRHHRFIFMTFIASVVATGVMFSSMRMDFLPSGDSGQIIGITEASTGTSYEQMVIYQREAAAIALKDPNVHSVMSSIGGGPNRGSTNTGRLFINLKPSGERTSPEAIIQGLRPKLSHIPGLQVYLQNPPALRIGGMQSKSQYQYTLQDLDQDQLQEAATKLTTTLRDTPGFADVGNDMDFSTPAVKVDINRDRAAALEVTPAQIEAALGAAYGGQQISRIYTDIDTYQVILELLPHYRTHESALSRLYVTAQNGALVPLTAVTTIGPGHMPLTINHLGQLPAVTVSFSLTPDMALSDAVGAIEQAKARLNLPATIQTSFQGTAQAFQESTASLLFLLVIAIVVIYIVLGILYESFIHPLTILSGLPSAAVGALLTLMLFGMPLSLYAFVGIIMLVGIVKKNAIMMIDFSLERERQQGVKPEDAILEAALIRFRPIMMTTMAALMGILPIAIGHGEGAESRQPLGIAVVGGLMLSQLLTLYITPVIYIYLDRLGKRVSQRRNQPRPAAAG